MGLAPDATRRVEQFVTLRRYHIWSQALGESAVPLLQRQVDGVTIPPTELAKGAGLLSYWLASLFVLGEGWKQLGLGDATVDALLTADHLKTLRRYRNAVFHFQQSATDSRFLDLITNRAALSWVLELATAFEAFFAPHAEKPNTDMLRPWVFEVTRKS